jgi:hypothetical protein
MAERYQMGCARVTRLGDQDRVPRLRQQLGKTQRVTMRVRKNVKLHLDWRQKLAGNARPGSGPALTLAGDF